MENKDLELIEKALDQLLRLTADMTRFVKYMSLQDYQILNEGHSTVS